VLPFAILPLRIKFYEFFLLTHIALVILALIGCWYHLVPHFGYAFGYQVWLYIAFAFWSADRFARVVRILYYNRLGRSTATVEAIPGCDIMQVTVFQRVAWGGPGQHSFLYLPGLGRFWESHPFSIVGWKRPGQQAIGSSRLGSRSNDSSREKDLKDSATASSATELHSSSNSTKAQAASTILNEQDDRPCIQFLIRVHSGLTSTLQRRLLSSPSTTSMSTSAYTEGPYAGHRATLQPLFAADTVLCLVGGIGITHVLGFIQQYASSSLQCGESSTKSRGALKKATRFILAWSAKEIGLIEHVKKNFLLQVENIEGIEQQFWCTGNSATASQKLDLNDDKIEAEPQTPDVTGRFTSGRMNIEAVIRSSLEADHQTTVLVCGPGSMADEATRHVVNCIKDGFKVDLVEEAYAW